MEEKVVARAGKGRASTSMSPAVTPHATAHDKPGSQVQPGMGGCDCSSGCGGGLTAGGGSGRAGAGRVCAVCAGLPPTGAKLQACGRCRSVRYCTAECQAKHWGEGGHKEACPQLREARERRKGPGRVAG